MTDFFDDFKRRQQALIDLLTALVNIESPSSDKGAVDKLIDFAEHKLRSMGTSSVERIPQTEVGDFIIARWNEGAAGRPILALMHLDTVWPLGTLGQRPVRIDDDGRLYGPGAVDMKGGVAAFLTAIEALIERNEMPDRPVWAFFSSDEEIGSSRSTPVIRDLAAQCELVLVLEPGTSDGALKTRRKGIATYRVHAAGRSSHAGNEPEQGINAIVEIAQQVVKLNGLNDLRNGTSVSVTQISGGTAGNVIPDTASIYIDTRMLSQMEMDRVREEIEALYPMVPGAELRIEAVHSRPPMEHNDLMRKSFETCKEIAARYGITVREDSVGGGSDGNTTASMGIATLDGLGPYGGGLHAIHEHVLISSLSQRTALIAALLKDWPAHD